MKGIKIIDEAVEMFNEVIEKLEKGMIWCSKENGRQDEIIKGAEDVIKDAEGVKFTLKQNTERAMRVRDKVKAIIE